MSTTPHQNAQNGVTGAYQGNDPNILRAMMAFAAIAWYNAIELLVLCLVTFKRYQGLYFWSLFITSFSLIPYTIGSWGRLVGLIKYNLAGMIVSNIGWFFMINGESVVLYSRLHLVTDNPRILKGILYMILANMVLLYLPTTVLAFGSQIPGMHRFVHGYSVMEKIQMTTWSLQEIIISGVYIWEVRRILRVMYEKGTRKLLYELVTINALIIALDTVLLAVEFMNLYEIEVTLKGMVYSFKLKMEFAVLSKLVKVVTNGAASRSGSDDTDASGMQRVTTADTAMLDKAVLPTMEIRAPSSPAAVLAATSGAKKHRPWGPLRSPGSSRSHDEETQHQEWLDDAPPQDRFAASEGCDFRDTSVDWDPTRLRPLVRQQSLDDLYPGRLV